MAAQITVPIILGSAGAELLDLDYLASQGVRICLQGHHPFLAAVEAVHQTLKAFRDGTQPSQLTNQPSPELMARVSRKAEHQRWLEDFLSES